MFAAKCGLGKAQARSPAALAERSWPGDSLPLECLLPYADFPVPELGVIPICPIYSVCVYVLCLWGGHTHVLVSLQTLKLF